MFEVRYLLTVTKYIYGRKCLAIFVFHMMLIVTHKGTLSNENIVLNKTGKNDSNHSIMPDWV